MMKNERQSKVHQEKKSISRLNPSGKAALQPTSATLPPFHAVSYFIRAQSVLSRGLAAAAAAFPTSIFP